MTYVARAVPVAFWANGSRSLLTSMVTRWLLTPYSLSPTILQDISAWKPFFTGPTVTL